MFPSRVFRDTTLIFVQDNRYMYIVGLYRWNISVFMRKIGLDRSNIINWLNSYILQFIWPRIVSFIVCHDDFIKWTHFPPYCPFAGNSPATGEFPTQGQWRGAFMFSLICTWMNGWENNREAGDLIRHRAHYLRHDRMEAIRLKWFRFSRIDINRTTDSIKVFMN